MSHLIPLPRFVASAALLGAVAMPGSLAAQHEHSHASGAVDGAMAGAVAAGRHVKLSPRRAPNAADSARAAAIAATLRAALAKYKDPRAAEADGYKLFAPNVKGQKVYHYTHWGHAVRNAFSFDPARPTALLYERGADGTLVLVGGMYTAKKGASPAELDERVPLSVAQWHLHVNLCVPGKGREERWAETRGGAPVFGPLSQIDTKEACSAAGGRFHPVLFNWMVHANVFQKDVWGHEH
jgi:hypothetical protein